MHQYVCRLLLWLILVMLFIKAYRADRDCDQTYYSDSGSKTWKENNKFRSPLYPKQYPTDTRCIYKFVGRPTERVKVEFKKFDVQGMFPDCKYDYIDVYIQLKTHDEPLLDAPLLGRFCGNRLQNLPRLMISTNNILVIVFYADHTKNGKGFEAEFEFIDASIYNSEALVSPSTCSYSFDSTQHLRGNIYSPTYPGAYPDNLNCTYELRGQVGQRIKLTFADFDLFHGGDYCPFDYVLIKDGNSMGASTIDFFCGKYENKYLNETKNVTIYSSKESLYINFVTRSGRVSFDHNSLDNNADYKFDRRGFNISYEFSRSFIKSDNKDKQASHVLGTECDVRITSLGGTSGTFHSPGYPNYPKDTTCRFYLDGQMNDNRLEKVVIEFSDFNISGRLPNCTEGYLAVNQKGHSYVQTIGEKFCGEFRPPEFTSEDPRLILTFNTKGSRWARFIMNYKFVIDYSIGSPITPTDKCEGLYQSRYGKSGKFKSPRYPQNYPPNSECTYLFTPRKKERLLISFDVFDLGNTSVCKTNRADPCYCITTDFLELNQIVEEDTRFGISRTEKIYYPVKRFCGRVSPAPILVETEIKLIFRSMNSSQGFRGRYDFISADEWENDIKRVCTHPIHSDGIGGVIRSPRYKQKYNPKTFCNWTIMASRHQNKILVQLETFTIEGKAIKEKNGRPDMDTAAGCKDAVLRLDDGKNSTEYCGKMSDISRTSVISSGDTAYIQFLTSTQALGAAGFQLTWTEVHSTDTRDTCYGFRCKTTAYCISSELQCNGKPNCGFNDDSDEKCPKEEEVQIVHIVIGTSISVFFCIVLLICGVYHRKKLRPRDRHSPEMDHVEVRYVAAGSGSNTTDRLLTIDKSETSPSSPDQIDQIDPDLDHSEKQEVPQTNTGNNSHAHRNDNNTHKHNHNNTQEAHTNCHPVSAPKVQKVSIV